MMCNLLDQRRQRLVERFADLRAGGGGIGRMRLVDPVREKVEAGLETGTGDDGIRNVLASLGIRVRHDGLQSAGRLSLGGRLSLRSALSLRAGSAGKSRRPPQHG